MPVQHLIQHVAETFKTILIYDLLCVNDHPGTVISSILMSHHFSFTSHLIHFFYNLSWDFDFFRYNYTAKYFTGIGVSQTNFHFCLFFHHLVIISCSQPSVHLYANKMWQECTLHFMGDQHTHKYKETFSNPIENSSSLWLMQSFTHNCIKRLINEAQ